MSELEYCRRCLFCCQTHRSPRVKYIGRTRESLQAYGPDLIAASSSPSSHNARPLLLPICSELFRCELVIYVHYMHCMLWCHNCHTASIVHCKELQAVHCMLAPGGYINFALWTTTAVTSLTLNCFIDYCYNCAWPISLTLAGLSYICFFSFSGLLHRTVACK